MQFPELTCTYWYLEKSARKVAIDLPIIQRFPCSWDLNQISLIGVKVQQGPFFLLRNGVHSCKTLEKVL